MRTLVLAPELFTTDSGIPRVLRTYVRAFVELAGAPGHVSFVTLNDASYASRDLPGVTESALRSWHTCAGQKGAFVRAALRAARHHDLILCGHLAQAPVAWLASRRGARKPYVVLVHGIEGWRRLGPLTRAALRAAAAIWCVSGFTRDQLLAHNPLPAERVQVLPSGLDPSFAPIEQQNDVPRSPVILTVSRLSSEDRYKGVDHLIQALPAVRQSVPNAHLQIVGRGTDRDRLYQLAGENGVRSHVTFSGFLNDHELRQAFRNASVFALPSAGEGFGLVYAEALAAGTPCIAVDQGGAREILNHETGLLVPYGDVTALSRALIAALQRNWSRPVLQERARLFSYPAFRDRLRIQLESLSFTRAAS